MSQCPMVRAIRHRLHYCQKTEGHVGAHEDSDGVVSGKWSEDPVRELESALALAEKERDLWMQTAADENGIRDYYRSLVVRCGVAIGEASFIADDGSRSADVLCAKVPELVAALESALALARMEATTQREKACDAEMERDDLKAELALVREENGRLREACEYALGEVEHRAVSADSFGRHFTMIDKLKAALAADGKKDTT